MKFKIIFFLTFISLETSLLIFALLTLNLSEAQAAELSLGVSPSILQIDALPPASIKAPLTVFNYSDQPVTLDIVFRPFTAGSETGDVSYLPKNQESSLFQKMQVMSNDHVAKSIVVGPKEGKPLTLHIGLPKDQLAEDHYFSLIFIARADSNKEQISQAQALGGVAVNVLLSVGPKEKAQGIIEEFSVPLFVEKGPVPFTVRVKNTGKHVIAPTGTILITNMFGQTIGKVELLPVNILAGTVRALPDSLKAEDATPSATLKQNLNLDGPSKIYWQETLLLGPYNATLTLSLSDQGPILSRTIRFIGAPIQTLFGLLLAIIIIYLIKSRLSRLRRP